MRTGIAVFVSLLIFTLLASLYFPFTSDDAFIALRFARNISQGLGPCFNPGEPSYGFTSPLWVYLLAFLKTLGTNLLLTSKILSFLMGLAVIIFFVLLAGRTLNHSLSLLLGLLALATDPWFLRWSPSGMESSLSAALVLLSILLFDAGRRGRISFLLAGFSSGLMFLVRPEGAWLAIAAGIMLIAESKWRGLLLFFLAFLTLVFPWLLFAHATFHHLLPNTFIAKAGSPVWTESLRALLRTTKIVGPTYSIEFLGFLLGSFLMMRRKEFGGKIRKNLFVVLWVFGLPFFYILAGVGVQSRYLLMLIPLIVLFGIKSWETFLAGTRRFWKRAAWILGAGFVLGTNLGFTFGINYPATMKFSRGVEECLIPLGNYLKNNTPPNAGIALVDIGVVGYYSERRIVDLGGLVHPKLLSLIVRYPREEILPFLPEAGFGKPDYFITRSPRPGAERFPGLEPLMIREFGPLGVSDPNTVWTYTLYRIHWDSLEKRL